MSEMQSGEGIDVPLEAARSFEKQQALLYRSLAALAEKAGALDLAQRFHDLHADEQHHLSRLTARLLELGFHPRDLAGIAVPAVALEGWEVQVRQRETEEIQLYRNLEVNLADPSARALVQSIIEVEQKHLAELGGKWTMA